ncbi:hypothetical protein LIA77_03652 [Sarocladium implicatum]|nr:hypothetical protein LIA77_03652 [Sarocladium implicatum]
MDTPDKDHSLVTTRSAVPVICGYDRSLLTIKWIKASLYVAGLCTVACWAVGCWVHITGTKNLVILLPLGEFGREAIPFVVSLVLTFTNDALGYVHTISLRWALYREGRLEWNTNLRLLTAARTSFANRWYMNVLATAMLTLSYACASLLLVPSMDYEYLINAANPSAVVGVNGMALMLLGASIFIQIVLALLCLREHDTQIPTWSASPLANTLTALYGHSDIRHRSGRCMMPVTQRNLPSAARKPSPRQPCLWTMRHVRWVVVFVWLLCIASLIWTIVMIQVDKKYSGDFHFDWAPSPNGSGITRDGTVSLYMYPHGNVDSSKAYFAADAQMFLALLFISLIQGIQALGLHCVELLVNMSRDEVVWQNASNTKGTIIGSEPLLAALSSWRTVALMILKTALHWVLGQSLLTYCELDHPTGGDHVYDYFSFLISPSRLLVFTALSAITAIFTTVLAFWQIRSPQPAAWGHLQTLADLVDDWRTVDRRLWWGDKKGVDDNGVRHAGTSYTPDEVDKLDMEAYYAGRKGKR